MQGTERLKLEDICSVDERGYFTSPKDGINYEDANVQASLIAGLFFKCGRAGFIEEAITNNLSKGPSQEERDTVEGLLYTQLLQFFNKYNSSMTSVVEQLLDFSKEARSTGKGYGADWTAEKLSFNLCFGSAGELGTLIGGFASGDGLFPEKRSFFHNRSGFGLGIEDKKFKESFSESFLKVFQNPNVVEECIKNTWFGRLALVEHCKQTKSISSEDRYVLKQILWENEKVEEYKYTGRLIPSYQRTNGKFFARSGKSEFDSWVGAVKTQLHKDPNNLELLNKILKPLNLKGLNLAVTSLLTFAAVCALAKYGVKNLSSLSMGAVCARGAAIALSMPIVAGASYTMMSKLEGALDDRERSIAIE